MRYDIFPLSDPPSSMNVSNSTPTGLPSDAGVVTLRPTPRSHFATLSTDPRNFQTSSGVRWITIDCSRYTPPIIHEQVKDQKLTLRANSRMRGSSALVTAPKFPDP